MDVSLTAFLASVAFISLSGVMMPGPLFAVTLARGQRQRLAGAWVSLGHFVVELPLVLLIWAGLGRVFTAPLWKTGVELLGGAVLVVIGLGMLRYRGAEAAAAPETPHGSLAAGFLTTLANPYFFLWWATVGAVLVLKAAAWGTAGVLAFFVVHWLCDLGWNLILSVSSHRAGSLWSPSVRRGVFAACGLVLVGFGLWFVRAGIS